MIPSPPSPTPIPSSIHSENGVGQNSVPLPIQQIETSESNQNNSPTHPPLPPPPPRRSMFQRCCIFCCCIGLERDPRISFLWALYHRPLLLNSILTSILVALLICNFLVDKNSTCKPDLRLWYSVMVGRSVGRLIMQIYIAGVDTNRFDFRGDIHVLHKIVEMFDVFGMVWFSVGNLLVFNATSCARTVPLSFYTSLMYICFSYLAITFPAFIRLCVLVNPPVLDSRFQPLAVYQMRMRRNLQNGDGEAGAGANNNDDPDVARMIRERYGADVSGTRTMFWKAWLEELGSFETSYADVKAAKTRARTEEAESNGNNDGNNNYDSINHDNVVVTIETEGSSGNIFFANEEDDFCPVCLSNFADDDDQIVAATSESSALIIINESNDEKEVEEQEEGSFNLGGRLQTNSFDQVEADEENNLTSLSLSTNDNSNATATATATATTTRDISINNSAGNESTTGTTTTRLVVAFPCSAEHIFHVSCLHSWLNVSSARGVRNVTCPCCREKPKSPVVIRSLPGFASLLSSSSSTAQPGSISSTTNSTNNGNSNGNGNGGMRANATTGASSSSSSSSSSSTARATRGSNNYNDLRSARLDLMNDYIYRDTQPAVVEPPVGPPRRSIVDIYLHATNASLHASDAPQRSANLNTSRRGDGGNARGSGGGGGRSNNRNSALL